MEVPPPVWKGTLAKYKEDTVEVYQALLQYQGCGSFAASRDRMAPWQKMNDVIFLHPEAPLLGAAAWGELGESWYTPPQGYTS